MIERKPENQVESTTDRFTRIMHRAVDRAQQESRQLGVPNVYSIHGILYYELPDGSLSREDPWQGKDTPPQDDDNRLPSE